MVGRVNWVKAPLALALLVVVLDQLAKWIVVREFGPDSDRHAIWLFGDWLGFSYAQNSGIAFGLLRERSTVLLVAGAVLVLVLIGSFVRSHRQSTQVVLAGGLIAGGAIGNMLDRIRLGYVRDFIAVGPWPSFNIADSAITVGVLIALFGVLKEERSSAGDNSDSLGERSRGRRAFVETTE